MFREILERLPFVCVPSPKYRLGINLIRFKSVPSPHVSWDVDDDRYDRPVDRLVLLGKGEGEKSTPLDTTYVTGVFDRHLC